MKITHHRLFLAAILFANLIITGCANNPVTGERQLMTVSGSREAQMGAEGDKQVREEYGVLDNPALQKYVNDIGQSLAAKSERANLQWHFTVLDSPEINAFALPGGYVYITRGILAYLNSEAELSGVLGHEIGHVTARHGAQQQSQGELASVLGVLVGVATGSEQAMSAVNQGASALILQHSREHESQADKLGAEYLYRTAKDPKSMISVINVLKLQEIYAADDAKAKGRPAPSGPTWTSTHPSNDQRLADIRKVAAGYAAVQSDAGQDRYLQAINGIAFGDAREQGVVRGNAFYHEPLGLTLKAPKGWQFQNSPQRLLIVSDDGKAAVLFAGAGTKNNHEQAIQAAFKPESGNYIHRMINGLSASDFKGLAAGKEIEATVVSLDGSDFILQALAKDEQSFTQHRANQISVIDSFRPMVLGDKIVAKPYFLVTLPMPVGGLANLGKQSPAGEPANRLINQQYPQGEIAAGTLVKMIQ